MIYSYISVVSGQAKVHMIIARNVVLHGGLAGTIDAPRRLQPHVDGLRFGLGIARPGTWRLLTRGRGSPSTDPGALWRAPWLRGVVRLERPKLGPLRDLKFGREP